MNEIKVDKNVAALKLIEILLEKGMINQATYTNIVKHATIRTFHKRLDNR